MDIQFGVIIIGSFEQRTPTQYDSPNIKIIKKPLDISPNIGKKLNFDEIDLGQE